MSAYVPDAIRGCYDAVKAKIPSAQLGGIYANKPGYHNCRNQLPSSDYSVQKSYDKKGDGNAASGLDITLGDSDMKKLTQRLIDETKRNGDTGKLRALREFFGTVNGNTVTGMDVPDRYWVTSDPSHLWHVHCSGKRQYANDKAAWADVAAVLLGDTTAPTPPQEEDVPAKLTAYYAGKPQPVSNTAWTTLDIDDDGSQSIKWGPADFWIVCHVTASGLPSGKAVKVRLYEIDVKDSGSKKGHEYSTTEILGTGGGSYGVHVEMGHVGKPASGYESRRLRLEALSDETAGVSITALSTRLFTQ